MPIWMQHVLVLSLAATCLVVVVWQGVAALRGKASRIGSCCAKGCGGEGAAGAKGGAERVVFLPVEMLGRKRR